MNRTNENDSALTFPCEFPIKIIGKADLEFQATALAIVRKHYPQLSESVDIHHSKQNNYISLTVTIQANSQEQLDAIYTELNANENVIMVL